MKKVKQVRRVVEKEPQEFETGTEMTDWSTYKNSTSLLMADVWSEDASDTHEADDYVDNLYYVEHS